MKVYVLWYQPKVNYDKEPKDIWGIYKTRESAEKDIEKINKSDKAEHGIEIYNFDIEEYILKE